MGFTCSKQWKRDIEFSSAACRALWSTEAWPARFGHTALSQLSEAVVVRGSPSWLTSAFMDMCCCATLNYTQSAVEQQIEHSQRRLPIILSLTQLTQSGHFWYFCILVGSICPCRWSLFPVKVPAVNCIGARWDAGIGANNTSALPVS